MTTFSLIEICIIHHTDTPVDLGMETQEIPDSRISVSSQLDSDHAYSMGRINNPLGTVCAWCSKVLDTNQWFQIDIGHTMLVTGVVTQPSGNGYQQWVTAYTVIHVQSHVLGLVVHNTLLT